MFVAAQVDKDMEEEAKTRLRRGFRVWGLGASVGS